MAKKTNSFFSLHESSSWGTKTSLLPFFFALFFVVLLVLSLSYDKVDYLLPSILFDYQPSSPPAVGEKESAAGAEAEAEPAPAPAPAVEKLGAAPAVVEEEAEAEEGRKEKKAAAACDLFSGRWVLDNSTRPLYSGRQCTYMHDEVACEKYGRKDLKHQLWRWQPHACDIPRFDAKRLLSVLRGKRMVFVGDSLNRNQWVSMVCMVESIISSDKKSLTYNGSLMSFEAQEYNARIDFYWAPLLVESNCDDPVLHRLSDRIIRNNSMHTHAKEWADADVLVFNSYLWWKKPDIKMKVLYGSFEGDGSKQKVKEFEMMEGFEMVLREWSSWLLSSRSNLNAQLFFVSLSPTHVWADEWGAASDQNCYSETEPIHREGYASRGSDYTMMHMVEDEIEQLGRRGVRVQILNITQLSEYRKDGHPSIYRRYWVNLTQEQLANPSSYSDCTHWCVPGVPDAWNELLYAYIVSSREELQDLHVN